MNPVANQFDLDEIVEMMNEQNGARVAELASKQAQFEKTKKKLVFPKPRLKVCFPSRLFWPSEEKDAQLQSYNVALAFASPPQRLQIFEILINYWQNRNQYGGSDKKPRKYFLHYSKEHWDDRLVLIINKTGTSLQGRFVDDDLEERVGFSDVLDDPSMFSVEGPREEVLNYFRAINRQFLFVPVRWLKGWIYFLQTTEMDETESNGLVNRVLIACNLIPKIRKPGRKTHRTNNPH